MDEVSIIGIDLAKRSFQLHGARADGSVFTEPGQVSRLPRAQPRWGLASESTDTSLTGDEP